MLSRLRPLALAALALVPVALLPAAPATAQQLRPWMQSEIARAWSLGFRGQGTSITVVDDFRSTSRSTGILRGTTERLRHGEWTALQTGLIAPSARVLTRDFGTTQAITLQGGLNTLNLSYGMMAAAGSTIRWTPREASIIGFARTGRAVVVKSAGNDGIDIGTPTATGRFDYLSRDLTGTPSTIFVGALTAHGSTARPATLAAYSNRPGADATLQGQFLVVGVPSDLTRLSGTSFAAPVVAGYAAVLGSKFTRATPVQITGQLLATARTDTIRNYSATLHGRGEASIARALAPAAIR